MLHYINLLIYYGTFKDLRVPRGLGTVSSQMHDLSESCAPSSVQIKTFAKASRMDSFFFMMTVLHCNL